MAFTRYHDDPYRIQKSLEESTFAGRYFLNTPGQGLQLPFLEEPQMRLQHWGANLHTDSTNLESDLFNIPRKLSRHNYDQTYQQTAISQHTPNQYPAQSPFVEESRASHPAWMYKDLEQSRWEVPIINPQARVHLEKGFQDNIHTRILEKDHYVPQLPDPTASAVDTRHGYAYVNEPVCFSGDKCSFMNSVRYE